MNKLLEVKDLTVAFPTSNGEKYAVNHISFDLFENDFVGLVGESGCGKTVATQTILGIESPSAIIKSGSCLLKGKEILGLDDKQWAPYRSRNIATVFQEPGSALNPLIKVGKQIEEVLKIHYDFDKKKRLDLVYTTMEKCGLKDVESLYHKYPHELSGGMQQRIVISMALIANPNVLIADEPTTALDAKVQSQIIDLFKEISHIYKGSIVFISHDLNLIENISKKVMIMYAGRIVERGLTKDVIDSPLHPYTKALLKAVPNYKKRGQDLYNIKGRVPDLKNRSNEGCPFADRCDFVMDKCFKTYPTTTYRKDHEVNCHLYGE